MALGDFTDYDVENRSISGDTGTRGGGSDGTGVGEQGTPPPLNLQVANAPGGNFLVTLTNQANVANNWYKSIKYRIYYLNLLEVAATDLAANVPRIVYAPGKRHWVQDVPVTPGQYTKFTLDSTPYLAGGWFYASGINATGFEGRTCSPCPLPIALSYVAPTTEVTAQTVTKAISQINGLNYATLTFNWTSVNDGSGIIAKRVQIFMSNYNKSGQVWEGPTYTTSPMNGIVNSGTWLLPCDDGTGGFPNPGAHSVVFYFVSLSSSYSHRADPTGAPSATLASGVHS